MASSSQLENEFVADELRGKVFVCEGLCGEGSEESRRRNALMVDGRYEDAAVDGAAGVLEREECELWSESVGFDVLDIGRRWCSWCSWWLFRKSEVISTRRLVDLAIQFLASKVEVNGGCRNLGEYFKEDY
jgi:hypothetical protein